MLIIALHSYKGGTGKTLLAVNLATLFTQLGKKVCLLDFDLRAPSLGSIFKRKREFFINDFLYKACKIENFLTEVNNLPISKDRFLVGLANPSTEAIREVNGKDKKWEMQALGRLLTLKTSLLNDFQFDYVFLDTSPGLQYSSINAIVTADVVLIIASPNLSDRDGTRRMVRDLYQIFEKKAAVIFN